MNAVKHTPECDMLMSSAISSIGGSMDETRGCECEAKVTLHSPAPWHRVGPEHPCCNVVAIADANDTRIAEVSEEQDVKILLAAPALADALGAIVEDFDNDNPAKDFGLLIDAARTALRAAGRLP